MPGVPSGRGCDACRKQKKKCDQVKPACARCSRLQILCVGSGVQRYKFLSVQDRSTATTSRQRIRSVASHELEQQSAFRLSSRLPSNECTKLQDRFINMLSVKDVRYDLAFTYGMLLNEVPKLLGTNKALDASAYALTQVVSDLGTGIRSNVAHIAYGRALSCLRSSLCDSTLAASSSTLCAIYVVWICQSWMTGDLGVSPGHASGIMKLLAAAPYCQSQDPFDQMMLATIIGPVIFESLFDSSVKIQPWMKEMFLQQTQYTTAESGSVKANTLLACIVRMPDLLRYNPDLLPEIEDYYHNLEMLSIKVTTDLEAAQATSLGYTLDSAPSPARSLIPPMRLLTFYNRSIALVASVRMLVNGILQAYYPNDDSLKLDSLYMSQVVLNLVLQAAETKPLAASWIPIALVMLGATLPEGPRKKQVESVWEQTWAEFMNGAPLDVPDHFSKSFDELGKDVSAAGQMPPSRNISRL